MFLSKSSLPTLFVAAAVATGLITLTACSNSNSGPAQEIAVTLKDDGFEPKELALPSNATLVITNKGSMQHNLAIPGLNVMSPTIDASQTTRVNVKGAKKGTYEFLCLVPGHKEMGMVGKATVH